MRYDPAHAKDDWLLLEASRKNKYLCTDGYWNASDQEKWTIFSELRLLVAAGTPPDRTKGNPEVEKVGKYKPSGVKSPIPIYVLKAKPSGWRLYFYVKDRNRRQIVFLHSVHKKTDERDPEDIQKCAKVLDLIVAGKAELAYLYLPSR